MKLDDRDIICKQDYAPLSDAELVTQIEENLEWLRGASLFDTERVMGPVRALLARAEAAEARVAELEAQLAAQQWRPVTEKPEKPGWYSVYDSDGHVFYNADIFPYRVARWTGKWDSAFNGLIDYWCPLPPAPQEPTP